MAFIVPYTVETELRLQKVLLSCKHFERAIFEHEQRVQCKQVLVFIFPINFKLFSFSLYLKAYIQNLVKTGPVVFERSKIDLGPS